MIAFKMFGKRAKSVRQGIDDSHSRFSNFSNPAGGISISILICNSLTNPFCHLGIIYLRSHMILLNFSNLFGGISRRI